MHTSAIDLTPVVDRLLRFDPAVVDTTMALIEDTPGLAMAHAAAAYLHLMSTERRDLAGAAHHAAALSEHARTDQEGAHSVATNAWVEGDWHGAARALDEMLVQWPTDLLALMIGHQLDFYIGDARSLRDRPARSVSALDPEDPASGLVRGMLAFGFEECGSLDRALDHGLAAVEQNPDDVWAIHAVAHVHEMRNQARAGAAFLRERVEQWDAPNMLAVHQWWHLALFHLELGEIDQVLEIHDHRIRHGGDDLALELLDASAMLWRLHLDGVELDDRPARLADAWAGVLGDGGPWYPFNDAHAAMAFVMAGRTDDASALLQRLERVGRESGSGPSASMTTAAGLPVVRALVWFGAGRYDEAIDELWWARRSIYRFGGSNAQRDVVERTLVESTLRAGRHRLADLLLAERLTLRPGDRFATDRPRRTLIRSA